MARGSELRAEGRVLRRGAHLCFCLVDITDESGEVVAAGRAVYKLTPSAERSSNRASWQLLRSYTPLGTVPGAGTDLSRSSRGEDTRSRHPISLQTMYRRAVSLTRESSQMLSRRWMMKWLSSDTHSVA
jgi:hypothetical protein